MLFHTACVAAFSFLIRLTCLYILLGGETGSSDDVHPYFSSLKGPCLVVTFVTPGSKTQHKSHI